MEVRRNESHLIPVDGRHRRFRETIPSTIRVSPPEFQAGSPCTSRGCRHVRRNDGRALAALSLQRQYRGSYDTSSQQYPLRLDSGWESVAESYFEGFRVCPGLEP